MHNVVREWIVEVLEDHRQLLTIAIRQRAKFEGWLKFELAAIAEIHGAQSVEVESPIDGKNASGERADLSFLFDGSRYHIELKTANSNWRMPGVENKTRPISGNVQGIVHDARKLALCSARGIVAFVLFPIPLEDDRWVEYLERIASEVGVSLSEREHCYRLSVSLEENRLVDLIVCSFGVRHSKGLRNYGG